MSQDYDVENLISSTEEHRSRALSSARDLDGILMALLDTAINEILTAAATIDCPYCRRHMELEAEELRRIALRIKQEGNSRHRHGIGERIRSLWVSLKIFYYVILGGLRRAGII